MTNAFRPIITPSRKARSFLRLSSSRSIISSSSSHRSSTQRPPLSPMIDFRRGEHTARPGNANVVLSTIRRPGDDQDIRSSTDNNNDNERKDTDIQPASDVTTAITTTRTTWSARLDRILSSLTLAFPLFVVTAAVLGLVRPSTLQWVNQQGPHLISTMLACVMCGTGLTLTMEDFTNILVGTTTSTTTRSGGSSNGTSKKKKNWIMVPLGVACQYLIMPLTAAVVGRLLFLRWIPPTAVTTNTASATTAASDTFSSSRQALFLGLVLVGCSPGGTASNLVSLLAKANVALSVILTACSTVLAVFMTPLLVKLLIRGGSGAGSSTSLSTASGTTIPISGWSLVDATARVVLLPVLVGMMLNAKAPKVSRWLSRFTPFGSVLLVSLICGGVVAQNADLIRRSSSTAVTGAAVSLPLIAAAVLMLHSIGFAAGYWIPKFLLPKILRDRSSSSSQATNENHELEQRELESACRTISIEVGMQNSALAVVLARSITSHPLASLPGALSATAHSCLGSLLAAYWRLPPRAASNQIKKKRTKELPHVKPQILYAGEDENSEFSI